MKKIFLYALALFLPLAPVVAQEKPAVAPPAPAADARLMTPVIAVVDIQRILKECAASKGVRAELALKSESYKKEIRAAETKLRDEQESLKNERSKLTEAQLAAKSKAFQEKLEKMQKMVQDRGRTLEYAMNDALTQIKSAAGKIVGEEAAARRANIVLDKDQVVVVESSLDLTAEVMEKLNKALPKVEVKFTAPAATPDKKN